VIVLMWMWFNALQRSRSVLEENVRTLVKAGSWLGEFGAGLGD